MINAQSIPQSIPELTNYEYNELSYNTASAPIKGSFVKTICKLLNKCGITVPETDTFDDKVEKAVKAFTEVVEEELKKGTKTV